MTHSNIIVPPGELLHVRPILPSGRKRRILSGSDVELRSRVLLRSEREAMKDGTKKSILVGISSCLLGEPVRYDGGHKRDRDLAEELSKKVRFVPICPETELGMGVPRNPVRLEGAPEAPRMVDPATGTDWTVRMNRYTHERIGRLDLAGLSGFILKDRSPSCGKEGVELYERPGEITCTGRGLFAQALMDRFPDLPIEEASRLTDPQQRENFLARVFAYHRKQMS